MHTIESILTLDFSEYEYLRNNLPALKAVSKNVLRTNYYSAKGITQIELRKNSFPYKGVQMSKHYLVLRINLSLVMGDSKIFVLDMDRYSSTEIILQLKKRLYEINEFRYIGIDKKPISIFRTNRADIASDILVQHTDIAVWLCNMSFPYNYFRMKRKRINKPKEILYFESCCFGSGSRAFNLYSKWAAIKNNHVIVSDKDEERARSTLRLEIQIKKNGIYNMARKLPTKRAITKFFDKDFCHGYLEKEILAVFGTDKYVSRSKAKEIINASIYGPYDKAVMLSIVDTIQSYGGLYELERAIASMDIYTPFIYGNLRIFKEKWLVRFKKLGINPVVIPDSFQLDEHPSIFELMMQDAYDNYINTRNGEITL